MPLRRMAASVLVAVVTATAIGLAVPGSAFALSYSKPCGDYVPARSQTAVFRGAAFGQAGGSDMVGVIADATVRNLIPCTNPSASAYDGPAMLPANLQAGGNNIVQLGWMKCGGLASQKCGNVPSDGNPHFMYICDDNSGGVACDATAWAGTPVYGTRYRFRIQYNQMGTAKWDYSITNLNTGIVKRTSIDDSWHNANGAWWGGEVKNLGSTMGPTHSGSNDINMYWMQYLRASIGSYQVVTNIIATGSLGTAGPHPAWYHEPTYSQNYTDDAINIWTEQH